MSLMKVCGYCVHFKRFKDHANYGECRWKLSEYSEGGTFSTNTCDYFKHHRHLIANAADKKTLCKYCGQPIENYRGGGHYCGG